MAAGIVKWTRCCPVSTKNLFPYSSLVGGFGGGGGAAVSLGLIVGVIGAFEAGDSGADGACIVACCGGGTTGVGGGVIELTGAVDDGVTDAEGVTAVEGAVAAALARCFLASEIRRCDISMICQGLDIHSSDRESITSRSGAR